MYSSNNPKISQHTRTQIWNQYSSNLNSNPKQKLTQANLAFNYGISRTTISKIIQQARKGDFSIKRPINLRFLTI
jgi:biotin operon repressor